MARPKGVRRSNLMRVDSDFTVLVKEVSKQTNRSMTETTKEFERKIRNMQKASVADLIAIPVFFFVIAIMVMLGYYTANMTNSVFINITAGSAMNETVVTNGTAKVVSALATMDSIYLFVMIAAFLASMIGAYYINTHPVAFMFAVVLLIISIMVNVYMSNAFEEFTGLSGISTVADQYPYIVTINQNLPMICLAFGALLLIVMFAGKSIRGDVRRV